MECFKKFINLLKPKPETEEEKIRRLDGCNYEITGAGVLSIKDRSIMFKTPRGKKQLEALRRIHESQKRKESKIILPK